MLDIIPSSPQARRAWARVSGSIPERPEGLARGGLPTSPSATDVVFNSSLIVTRHTIQLRIYFEIGRKSVLI